jgi:ribosomal protein S18 acetylase RimI-like enzyme
VPIGAVFTPVSAGGGPYIVKPCARDASEGIGDSCVFAEEGPELQAAVKKIHEHFNQPALVEQYVGTREFNISILQQGDAVRVLPIAEIDFSAFEPAQARIVDYAAKWQGNSFQYKNTRRVIPAQVGEELTAGIREVSLAAWHAVGCRDYARVDLRADDTGRIFVLEVNPNPDVSPDAGFPAALAAAGLRFEEFVETVVANAFRRRVPEGSRSSCNEPAAIAAGGVGIRRVRSSDRKEILRFIEETRFFRDGEVATALEVLDESIFKGQGGHYQSFVAELDGKAVGWVCFGPTPCTLGTYDIYWLVVDLRNQGKGIGKALIGHAEKLIAERGGRIAVIETSGHGRYQLSRIFYSKAGFAEQARLEDFYAPGDDKIVCIKRLK